ncbi:kinesin-like protein [Phytophthora infestans T30-4]|uniref:Kinesin-like protein n=1 Tax=Phytophthora infestans (strain T30-4) TaxID=403677 RepID=D0N6M3_PHYIT|nr:kinesin-like protein [Phytophthora infestans T30-4]EEY53222.1 kinesin-like protein [Phytophthora infestans T30-4]|eukprot:XP_002904840.1 kinesin-like protein [Phytophthora infestans T30-4]
MTTRGIQVSCRVRHETTYSCFDGVYSGESAQTGMFEAVGRPFVADLLCGFNCTIIAYGQTGSGKTYTVVGGLTPETRGLIPRAMETIFEEMARIDSTEYDVSLTASFVEIYQEKIRDLLLPHSSRALRLREDKDHAVCVEGASEIAISSVAGGMAILSRGNAQRSIGSTLMNADSSRSHAILILTFSKKHLASGTKVRGRMVVVDLAGSEKVQKTAATGVRMEEAKHINRSLSALGNVINALTDDKIKHVPYRDSKLTRLLQTSLGGNAKTHLLLTCSANTKHLEETLSTLRFGSRAKNIQNSPHVNKENGGAAAFCPELLTTLQNKIENLHSYIRQLEMTRCDACKSRGSVLGDPANTDGGSVDDLIADELMRAEMQSLRKALTSMMRDHETQEHAHDVARAMMEVTEQQLDSRHRSQEQIIHQQQRELQDACATISRLERKLEILEENAQGMKGENAETEILRRRLDASTKLSKQLQTKLTALRQEQHAVADLKEKLESKEHELRSLRCEMEVLRVKILPVSLPGTPSPLRSPQTRPVTAVDYKSLSSIRGDARNAGMNNIHNWWTGSGDGHPAHDNGVWLERRDGFPSPASKTAEGCADNKREDSLHSVENAASRVSSAARPFRARLVGLLNSLEEETTAYRELAVETKERSVSRGGRRQLPCLDVIAPTSNAIARQSIKD